MTPDPKLVEALELEMLNDAGYDPEAIDDEDRRVIRERLARHRLVQLPEEPDGWEVEYRTNGWDRNAFIYEEGAAWEAIHHGMATGRIRPVWTTPGDPQEVDP